MSQENPEKEENPAQVYLVVVKTDDTRSLEMGRRFPVFPPGIQLGNAEDADIPLGLGWPEPCQISILFKETTWYVQEVKGYSHLFVNGVSVQKFHVFDGDIIQMGDFAFELSFRGGIKFGFFEDGEKARQEDLVTHAYTRSYLYSVLDWEINRYKKKSDSRRKNRSTIPMSLIMFDIDHFGGFNKKHDHQVGDAVLRGVVERAKSRLRTTDVLARYGGDEFYAYLPDTNLEQAAEVAEQLRKQVGGQPFFINDQKKLRVTITLGVVEYQPGMDREAFMRAANLKMLEAKEKGRNRVVM